MITEPKILTDEKIAELYSLYRYTDGISFADIALAIEQAALQSPEIQALRKDAERYRYLRQAGVDYSTDLDVFDAEGNCLNEEELDGAVDAAMEK